MTHLYCVRHGDYLEGLEQGKYQDLGLSPEGIGQMERLLIGTNPRRRKDGFWNVIMITIIWNLAGSRRELITS